MRIPTFTACVAWLLLGLIIDLSIALTASSALTTRPTLKTEETTSSEVSARAAVELDVLGIADIPSCGVKCLIQYIPQSGCSITDTLCVCTNATLGQSLSACMLANCTIMDNIETARVNAQMCMLSKESQRRSVIVYTISVYAIALSLVTLRLAGKFVSKRLAWNDVPIVAAVLLSAVPIASVLAMARIGFGEHLWNLEDGTFLPILRYFYVAWSTYVAILGLIKLSLIMFYLDVFPTRSFKIVGWIVFSYIGLNTFVILLLTIFACTPVSAFWNRDLKGKCMDIQMLGYANSISAIVQDVILVVLPMYYLRSLQMKRSRKIAVALMFLIGSFGCVTTIIRLRTLLAFKISYDPTWDYVPIVIWTELEITAAFACVSLPAIRVLLSKMIPSRVKGWLSDVTNGSHHRTPKRTTEESSSKRDWRKDDMWINLTSTEYTESKEKDKIGILPSADESASHLSCSESTSGLADRESPSLGLTVVPLAGPERPSSQKLVSIRSKFSV